MVYLGTKLWLLLVRNSYHRPREHIYKINMRYVTLSRYRTRQIAISLLQNSSFLRSNDRNHKHEKPLRTTLCLHKTPLSLIIYREGVNYNQIFSYASEYLFPLMTGELSFLSHAQSCWCVWYLRRKMLQKVVNMDKSTSVEKKLHNLCKGQVTVLP